MPRSVAILGASADRAKFGNMAVRAFARQGFVVFPVNPSADSIEGHPAFATLAAVPSATVDVVSVYLPARIALPILDEIVAKRPTEVWLNPGADSPEVVDRAQSLGLPVRIGCSILAIGETPDRH